MEELIDTTALDRDDFDQHECMGVVLRLVEHLHVKFGANYRLEMPDWMKSLHATFENAGKLVDLIPLKYLDQSLGSFQLHNNVTFSYL